MSEQKTPKMFRTVFGGGYQKSDVNAYIETMLAEFRSVEQTLKNTINHQRTELDALRHQNDEAAAAKEAAEQLQAALDGTAEKLGQTCEELDACKAACIAAEAARATAEASVMAAAAERDAAKEEAQSLSAERDAAVAELAALRAQYEALLAQQHTTAEEAEPQTDTDTTAVPAQETGFPEDYESLKLKAEQYDRMSAHIGAIMLKANAGAEDILSRAKTDADAMVAEVNGALAETRTRAQTAADTLIADVGRSLGEISRSCREDIAMDLEELRTALRTLEDTVSSKYADISRKLDYAKEEMEQTSGAIIRAATEPAAPMTGN